MTYISGPKNADVDCFSRDLPKGDIDAYLDDCCYAVVLLLDVDAWREEYTDPESLGLLASADLGNEELEIINDLLYKAGKIYVPMTKRSELLQSAHNSPRG